MKRILLAGCVSFLFFSCNNNPTVDHDDSLTMPPTYNIPAPAPMMFKVEAVYPHDATAFTQGLEIFNGKIYEGTGEEGQSRLRIVDIKSGKSEKDHLIEDKTIFGEGITIFQDKIYQLTWKNNKIFVYNLDNIATPANTLNWSREGWGITHDDQHLIISDGTSKIFYAVPAANGKELSITKILTVIDNRGEVDMLNELELINGDLYANVWLTDKIVRIDTANGHVTGVLNLKGILQQYDAGVQVPDEAVLNGIAYDSVTNKMYITGKKWPRLFEISLQ